MLQGATAGVGVVIGRAVIRDLYEGARAQRLMSITTMIFSIAPAVAPIIGGWAHVAFGWRAVFAVMTICGLLFALSAWWKLPETHPPTARVPFNARNLVAMSSQVLRHPEFLMLAIAAAVNFGSLAVYIGSAPAIVEMHWGKGETDYFMLFLPVICGILTGAVISTIFARHLNLLLQVRIGMVITFVGALARALLHATVDDVPIPLQQGLMYFSGIGAQFAFPALTLRMLDLFPAARGTAAAAQSFMALIITAFTFGMVAPHVLARLDWLAWTSLVYATLASLCWYLSRRWHAAHIPISRLVLDRRNQVDERAAQLGHLRRLAEHAVHVLGRFIRGDEAMPPAREHDDGHLGRHLADARRDLAAVDIGHAEIGDHRVEVARWC